MMPAPLRQVSGEVRYDTERLWTPSPVEVQAGDRSRGLLASIDLRFPGPNRFCLLLFEIGGEHLALDEWIRPWDLSVLGDEVTEWPPDSPFDPDAIPEFSLRGSARTQSGEYWGVSGQRFEGEFDLDIYSRQPGRLRWHNIEADVYGGRATMDGSLSHTSIEARFDADKVSLPPLIKALRKKDQENPQGIFSGDVTGHLELRKQYDQPPPQQLLGQGDLLIQNSQFISNKIFYGLGGLLKLPIFNDITFSTIRGPFTIEGPRSATEGLDFSHPLMNLKMKGTVGPDRQLDLGITIEFLQIVKSVPLIGNALELFNRLAGKVLNFQVRGTIDEPKVEVL